MNSRINFVAAAFSLTALSYGLARFAYGLLLPQIREDLAVSVTVAGWIGGSAFAAYCLGISFVLLAPGKLSARTITLLAGLTATFGMLLVALSASAWVLAAGIALAGLSTGLTSPPLAFAVSRQFGDKNRPKANATINAGTAAGIVFSGMAAWLAPGSWREIYFAFVLTGAAVTVWLWFAFPRGLHAASGSPVSWAILKRPGLFTLCVSAFFMGVSSAAIWTFAADILRDKAGFTSAYIALIWVALGISGLVGALTGVLTNRFGIRPIHAFSLLGMAVATAGLVMAPLSAACGFVAVSLFGAAYIVSTGVYLIQGTELLADRPDLGLGIPFLAVATGQAVGNPLFGALLASTGLMNALLAFAATAGIAAFIRPSPEQLRRRAAIR
ncbi:MFS transporter [Erwinia sp. P6884]|uniref:MFS transporter n=1 Tax=Erwinia sp. P6884 TaxID=3141450 RepID=UPI00318D262B